MKDLSAYLVNAGPINDDWGNGWQIAFDFGPFQASVAWTPYTQGVELMAWGLADKPLTHVTPEQVVYVLRSLLERSVA